MKPAKMDDKASALFILDSFLAMAQEDPRMATAHISLFILLWKHWRESGRLEPTLTIFSSQLRPFSKISSPSTYHKTIRELHQYGYIFYQPSFNRYKGSYVQLIIQ
jgi:hypothetical protein